MVGSRVPVLNVECSVDEFAPLFLLRGVGQVRAEGLKDGTKSHDVWDVFSPCFYTVR